VSAIDNLHDAIVTAAGKGSFALDAAFLTAGLGDAGVTVPADYDTDLCAAFQVAAASTFIVSVDPADVGPVADGSFTATGATIPFPGAAGALSLPATLVFAVPDAAPPVLVVQIGCAPGTWTWTDSFPFMFGWPFDQLVPSDTLFVFSTADGVYPWNAGSPGPPVVGGPNQSLTATIPMPAAAQAVVPLFGGLSVQLGQTLALRGVLDMSAYDGETVLLPSGTLSAILQDGSFEVLYLKVSNPSLTLKIPAASSDPADTSGQAATLTVAALLGVGSIPADLSPYTLQVMLSPPVYGGDNQYAIGLGATGASPPLTPDAIVALVGGSSSYLTGVPSVLQEFLVDVGLLGLSMSGTISPAAVEQVSVLIGSSSDMNWTPIPAPPPGLDFTVEQFSLTWTINDPSDVMRSQLFLFQTRFTLAPAVFKGPDGVGDGLFTVEFDSTLNFSASFAGTAGLQDFLYTLTAGAVSLPSSISATLSDIRLMVDGRCKSFSFSSGFDVLLSFLTVNGMPILSVSSGTVAVGASTPPDGGGEGTASVWQSSFGGLLAIGPFQALVSISHDGGATPPLWTLSASLGQPLTLTDLIKQFFTAGGTYAFPDFLPGTLTIETFTIVAKIPSGPTGTTAYVVDVDFQWSFSLGDQQIADLASRIGLTYDGTAFSGSVAAQWTYPAINMEFDLTYQFQADGNTTLSLSWEGFTATCTSADEVITFSLKGWTLGSLLQALVRTLGDPYFTLDSPWDLLNQIPLDGLQLNVSLQEGVTNRVSASYTLSSPLDLGFVVIDALSFTRTTDGKVTLEIQGSSPIPDQLGDLMKPGGQDVQDMPSVPGRSEDYFKVFLLVLGQRIGITGSAGFASTEAVISALANMPSTTGDTNPVNPDQTGQPPGLPYYEQGNNWLIAGHLGFLRVAGAWTVDAMFVFNDPNLYSLRLALAGPKAGGLAGVSIDILYKKITDDIGLFQIDFSFPDSIRNIDLGALSITLPQIAIQIYTNGDFLIDIGFPYNNDFSQSFSIYAIVGGVPVMGSGDLYFGKLSSATATQVPATDKGTFDPVMVFGIGLQLGLGYSFTAGPLTADFSLTMFGIIEGVIAAWHPYQLPASSQPGQTSGPLQDEYYFKLTGTVGIIGTLNGKVDFAIIQASVSVKIVLSAQITYESYRQIPISASAYVGVSVSVKIDLGLFSISISFSFSMTVTASFTIGQTMTAPWDVAGASALSNVFPAPRSTAAPVLGAVRPKPKRVVRADGATPTLKLLVAPQFTVLAPPGATSHAEQQGAFVFLMAMDAPTADAGGSGSTSFDQLCAAYFPWLIDALGVSTGDAVVLADTGATVVSAVQLQDWINRLVDTSGAALDMAGLLGFLGSAFNLDIVTPDRADSSGDKALFQAGSTIFPVFDGLSLTVPDPSGSGSPRTIDFDAYATADDTYRAAVAALFSQVEANMEHSVAPTPQTLRGSVADDTAGSMAALIFVDYFSMIGRQLLQAALNLLGAYAWPLTATDSIAGIQAAVNAVGANALTIDDIATPNQNHALSAGVGMTIPPLVCTIQAGDTLDAIADRFSDPATTARRWQTTTSQLITANWTAQIIQPGVALAGLGYMTVPGDSFQSIGAATGLDSSHLAQAPSITSTPGLLVPLQPMAVAPIAYTTAAGDTLATVAALFATTVPALAQASRSVAGLFSVEAEGGLLTLANLQAWNVSDLWTAIAATDQVAQTAGMVSRFLMFGLNLPASPGLTLSGAFLFPTTQSFYALYQLTGQEFPTPAPTSLSSYPVTLSAAAAAHGVDLGFVQFNGSATGSATLDLATSYADLCTVLEWAQAGNFQPSPGFAPVPSALLQPKAVPTGSFAYWSSSDMASLQAITARTGSVAMQSRATLWMLPPSIVALAAARQARLDQAFDSLSEEMPLLPRFQPQRGITSPATRQTDYADLGNWAWTTRVDFSIKKLPLSGATSGGAGNLPRGPASAPSLPNVYEVTGTTTADARTLEQLLAAINALGEEIISGLFVCYQQQTQPPALVTLGVQEFLTFITQTNLSTETNPGTPTAATTATAAPRGIGNSPTEFIKLLWKQSTVRSGGYYLFHQVIADGSGFPPEIFDANGNATLSMIATFVVTDQGSFGNSLPSFVNSFVTTDPIDVSSDVIQVSSLPSNGQSAPLTGASTETLATIADLYGAAPGRLAEANKSLVLTTGAVIPLAGLTRQLSEDDLADPGQTLATLAAYYSQGAGPAITAADIQAFNPNVPVALGSVFYIPTVNYAVSPTAAPGNTFAQLADYYGISVAAIAVRALGVGGLFAAGTVLAIDTQSFDLRTQLPPGNITFALTRDDPGPPSDDSADPDYSRAFMYSLYNTLSAGIQANQFFQASPMGLPFGPQDPDQQAPSAFASHADGRRRRRRAAAATTAVQTYSRSLGFKGFSTVNPAPPPAQGLPSRDANPYVGVGTTCQVALQWQDLFGNTTLTPFTNPPGGYTGALNGSAVGLLYTDLLVGLSAWTNTTANYLYTGTAGSPVLTVSLSFSTVPYKSSPEQAAGDLQLYQKIYFQLTQDYTGLGVPGVTGNAVTMSLTNSLLAAPETVLTDDQAAVVRNYVAAVMLCLQAIIGGGQPPASGPTASLAVDVPLSGTAGGDIIALEVTLVLTRLAVLVDPQIAADADGLAVASTILPRPDPNPTPGAQPAFLNFAQGFEAVFQCPDWQMRVGEGLRPVGSGDNGVTGLQLWAVRFGTSSGKGLYFSIAENAPIYYAAMPVANSLVSRQATITDYRSGGTVTLSFTGVDQNQWFQTCLDAIDAFLSAGDSTSAFILDRLSGTEDPMTDGYLGQVLAAKAGLADSIAGTVAPILSTGADTPSTRAAAANTLRQQLLNRIGSAYAAGAVVVYGVTDVSGGDQPGTAGPPDIYGQPQGTVATSVGASNQNFALSAGRIPLGQSTVGGAVDPCLSFFFSTKNVGTQAYVPLLLNFAVTHLEFNKTITKAGIDGHVESQWLVFITGPFVHGLNPSMPANIPVVNRNLPLPPTVQNQTAHQSSGDPAEPVDLTRWDYAFTYTYPFAAQDSVQTTIKLNVPVTDTGSVGLAAEPDLFTALAQFVTAYPAIAEDFRTYLAKIDAETVDQTIIDGAGRAVSAFAAYLSGIATAHAGLARPKPSTLADAPALIEVDFETALTQDDDGNAVTNLLNVTINGNAATWDPSTATISAGGITLPVPVLAIEPESYMPVATQPTDPASLLTYVYTLRGASAATYLSWDEAVSVQQRTVLLPGLDVLLHQNGQSSIMVERNSILFPLDDTGVSTSPAFVFTTPDVSFPSPAVPRLVHQQFPLDTGATADADLETLLDGFFSGLFAGGDGSVSVEVAMTGSYIYPLTQDFPVRLPVCLLPPVPTPVDPTGKPSFTATVAGAVDDWMEAHGPNTADGAGNSFKLTLFGANDKQPLLVVNDLRHTIPSG